MNRYLKVLIGLSIVLAWLFGLLGWAHLALEAKTVDTSTADVIWRDVDEAMIPARGERLIIPAQYRTVEADLAVLDALLAAAPQEQAVPVQAATTIIALPLPDGTMGRFRFVNSPLMEAPLAARYPEITTYLGQGIDDPLATVRFDRTPAGFHAMILAPTGTVFIDPYRRSDTTHYISYFKREFKPTVDKTLLEEAVDTTTAPPAQGPSPHPPSGPQLRTYRAAVAATGEYTIFHGGTVAAGLAAIVTSMNRVVGVYEKEVAVRMVLVANNNLVVYTDPITDPYTNNDGGAMLGENQTNLDMVIGNANYDIGHVFSTGGGGIANLGVPCRTGLKARGVTGQPNPIGDPFDIDYVAHEIGHQFNGNHTFNGTTDNCGGGNRNPSTAYEPGSGSTIMAYAGICGAEDLQPHSDAYFHTINFDEIVAYTTVGMGNSCAAITNTGNNPPSVNAGASYTIPQQTYFRLTGSATDPDGDPLTYGWEQFNLGAAAPPNTDDGTRPIFRSFNPTSSPTRLFPKLSDILNNTTTLGEALPQTNRTLTFRLTARDNRAGGGGVNYSSVNIPVTTSSGPFLVTAPNTAVTWPGLSQQTVTWDVANTTAPPVSCATVNILLSTNGGLAFGTTLVANTANDGSEQVMVPNLATTQARVLVECATNIFFDVSNTDFTITLGATATPTNTPVCPVGTPTRVPTPAFTPAAGCQDRPRSGDLRALITDHPNTTDALFTNRSNTCSYRIGLAIYKKFDNNIDNQELYDYRLAVIPPNSSLLLTVNNPTCAYQADAFWGDLIESFAGGVRYGERRLADTDSVNRPYCTIHCAPPGGATPTPMTTPTPPATATLVACAVPYNDVPTSHPFYPYIRCLTCHQILAGYADSTFRPNNNLTRSQAAKIIGAAAGYNNAVPATRQTFSDVPPSHPFWLWIERAADQGVIMGYADGTFRPNENATRGQLVKMVTTAAGYTGNPTIQTFTDVPPSHPFYLFVERAVGRGILNGYGDGTFRPANTMTRGQAAKVVTLTFFPNCTGR